MLSRLHGHVEQEESRWSQHVAELQQQLDEARRQLDDRIHQNSGHNNIGQNNNSEDESNEAMAITEVK